MFAVPFAFDRHPDPTALNAELRALFLAREAAGSRYQNPDPGTRRNGQVFESHFDLFNWPEPCVQRLREFCLAAVVRTVGTLNGYDATALRRLEVNTDAWFHITRHLGFFALHNHPNATWSAVYCVSPGQRDASQPDSGALSFMNPHSTKMMYLDPGVARMLEPPFGWTNFNFQLEPGQLVIFPSWVMHQVMPFYGTGERITVALNCAFRLRDA
ncbi:MAG TPA: putative 2OG-Fe(II) oxygenase [Vicinamibacterales bacterium]|nr:putative 2OG-Fe(II) oxygenase [Vicinamibacterales bacterium]